MAELNSHWLMQYGENGLRHLRAPDLAKAIKSQLAGQRAKLQKARDDLQIVVDNFEDSQCLILFWMLCLKPVAKPT